MCWICEKESRVGSFESYGSSGYDAGSRMGMHFKASATGFYDSAGADGQLLGLAPSQTTALLLPTADDVPGDIGTNRTIEVNGSHIVSTIETIGDQDFFKVELQAGLTYEIGQYAKTGGPGGVPLADAFIELYDAAGNLVTYNDGGGKTPSGELYGLDAMLTFTPEVSGTYYINARAFDNNGADGDNGDLVGDYELFVDLSTYKPYYDTSSPLHSIDWGTQVDGTSRNPDGAEGPRVTGNEFTGSASNPYGVPAGKNVITVYFAKAGDVFVDENPADPGLTTTMIAKGFEQWEKDAFTYVFDEYEKVADIVYVEVDDRYEADFVFVTYLGTPGRGAPSLLGRMSPPDTANEGQAEFNAGDERWTEAGLAPGGFTFITMIHELGHGHGLAHPHDAGGRSSIMRGVTQGPIADSPVGPIEDPTGVWPDYTLGDYELNQGVWSMMSYQDGWQTSPYGQASSKDGYGWLGGLMAFDIAAIQDKYGVNEEAATGNDVYTLKDENAPGTFYYSIWDAGGNDTIQYGGARDANIDLRAATLQYEYGGGGWVSYAYGIHGGYTIANGVTIENATSGSGNDTLIGNDAANVLSGGAGNDSLSGGGGGDRLVGGAGTDTLTGGAGNDIFVFDTAGASPAGAGRDKIVDFERGSDKIDFGALGASSFIGTGNFSGKAGEVRYASFAGTTIVELDSDGNRLADFQIELTGGLQLDLSDFVGLGAAPATNNDRLVGTAGADTLRGFDGDDVLIGLGGDDRLEGGNGSDTLIGGAGRDLLNGGAGADIFRIESVPDSPRGPGRDRIEDFQQGSDRIDLSAFDLTFIGSGSFTGAGNQLRSLATGTATWIEADLDGDRLADIHIELATSVNLTSADFMF